MKRELIKKISIPEGVTIEIDGSKLNAKGKEGELSREFNLSKSKMEQKGNEIYLSQKTSTKNEKKMMNTIAAHIENMLKGVSKKFEYTLKVCYGHFPFTIRQDGNKVWIKNFLGEKVERVVELPNGIDIEIKKDIITIKSVNKELAGQASANFETATKVRGRDKRIFQDGIYIIEKDGKKM